MRRCTNAMFGIRRQLASMSRLISRRGTYSRVGYRNRSAACLPHLECRLLSSSWSLPKAQIMANPKQATEILTSMKQMGLLITVDDFGTGYSSLAHLNRLPIDVIKIDKSFVMKMATEAQT